MEDSNSFSKSGTENNMFIICLDQYYQRFSFLNTKYDISFINHSWQYFYSNIQRK